MGSTGRIVGIFLQARMGSTRLPGKILLPLGGRPAVEHAMEALRRVPAQVRAILTDSASADALAVSARACGFRLFVGPEHDVLARYAMAVEAFGVEVVLRATGDNPLVSAELACSILDHRQRENADYAGYRDIPVGAGVEAARASALLEASREATDPYEREHVMPFLYRRPERYRIEQPLPPTEYRVPGLRITLDTPDDYRFLRQVFDELYEGDPIPLQRLLDWSRAPQCARENAGNVDGHANEKEVSDAGPGAAGSHR